MSQQPGGPDDGADGPIDQYYQGKSLEEVREDVLDANFPERMQRRERAEQIAKEFHEVYEELAPQYGYKTREASAVPWDQVPAANRQLMVATCDRLLRAEVIQ